MWLAFLTAWAHCWIQVRWYTRSSGPFGRAVPKLFSPWPALMHTVFSPGCRTLHLSLLNIWRFLKHLLAHGTHTCDIAGCPCTRSLVSLGTLALHMTTCRISHLIEEKKDIQSFHEAWNQPSHLLYQKGWTILVLKPQNKFLHRLANQWETRAESMKGRYCPRRTFHQALKSVALWDDPGDNPETPIVFIALFNTALWKVITIK